MRQRERETGSHHSGVSFLNRGLCANTYEHHHCVCHATLFPFLELMVKLRTLLTVFIFTLKTEARDYCKGRYIKGRCTGSVGQSEQTTLVGRRGFVENDVMERGGA